MPTFALAAGAEDVAHLVDGMGKKGLTGLFEALAVLSWAVSAPCEHGHMQACIALAACRRFQGPRTGRSGQRQSGGEWMGLRYAHSCTS